jgi:hypothetical protein
MMKKVRCRVSDDDAILSGLKIDIQLAIFSFVASYPRNPESHVASATDSKSREQRHAGSGEGEWAGGVNELVRLVRGTDR